MAVFLITGANRGFGAALTDAALAQGHTVYATARDTTHMPNYKHQGFGKLHPVALDLDDSQQIKALAKQFNDIQIDYLINNAGISLNNTFMDATEAELVQSLRVNLIAPFLLTQTLLTSLSNDGKIIQLSSGAASQTNTPQFKGTPLDTYAISKSALNMFTLRLSLYMQKNQASVAISPGWIKTDMGGPNAPDDPTQVAQTMLKTLLSLTAQDNGRYIDYENKVIDW